MSSFSRIVIAYATGPGIASPTIDFHILARGDLSEADALGVDHMLAACNFFKLESSVPKIKIFDGPHKSNISVETTEGTSHGVGFLASDIPEQLSAIVELVMKRGKHSGLEGS